MLDTAFERYLGDIGNPASFQYPVRYQTVVGASVERVIDDEGHGLIEPFIEAALQLERAGAAVIGTSCGFLIDFQDAIQARLNVPFLSSALLALNNAASAKAIMTFDAKAFAKLSIFRNLHQNVSVAGLEPTSSFVQAIRGNAKPMNLKQCEAEILSVLDELITNARFEQLILECTNLSVHRDAIKQSLHNSFGLSAPRVIDLINLLEKAWEREMGCTDVRFPISSQ